MHGTTVDYEPAGCKCAGLPEKGPSRLDRSIEIGSSAAFQFPQPARPGCGSKPASSIWMLSSRIALTVLGPRKASFGRSKVEALTMIASLSSGLTTRPYPAGWKLEPDAEAADRPRGLEGRPPAALIGVDVGSTTSSTNADAVGVRAAGRRHRSNNGLGAHAVQEASPPSQDDWTAVYVSTQDSDIAGRALRPSPASLASIAASPPRGRHG